MDIERLRQAVIDKRFILSANPDWRAGRSCGLSGDETEQKANNALTIILENIEELVVAYLIDSRQSVKSEDVQMAIDQVEGTRRKAQKKLDSLIETKSRYDHQIEIGDPWNWKWEESWHPLAVEGHKQTIKNANLVIAALQAYQPWIPVSNVKPESGKHVLLCCEVKPSGKRYVCDGYYAGSKSITSGYSDDWDCEYDEETDEHYLPEGYYEVIKNWDDYSSIAIEDFVTHWKPLPEPPKGE